MSVTFYSIKGRVYSSTGGAYEGGAGGPQCSTGIPPQKKTEKSNQKFPKFTWVEENASRAPPLITKAYSSVYKTKVIMESVLTGN